MSCYVCWAFARGALDCTCPRITTSAILFSVRCVLEIWCGWFWVVFVLQAEACKIQQHSRKLLMMDILMSETCWVHKKWNKIASDIKLVFHSSKIKCYFLGLRWKSKLVVGGALRTRNRAFYIRIETSAAT